MLPQDAITVSLAYGIIESFEGLAQEAQGESHPDRRKRLASACSAARPTFEEGFEVEAYETIPDALAVIRPGVNLPDLILVDISASDDPAADVEALTLWSRKVPVWIIASRTYIVEKGLRGHGFEMILLRPVDVGELVDQIKQRLEGEQEVE